MYVQVERHVYLWQTILGKVDHFKSVVAEIKDLPVKADYLIATLPLRRKELDAYAISHHIYSH
jgi:hypothetical protein